MIRFLLDVGDGRTEEIALGDDVPADLSVLDWLRFHRGLSGTKEGCGSGDCGACTVVVASLDDRRTLPALHAPATPGEVLRACTAPRERAGGDGGSDPSRGRSGDRRRRGAERVEPLPIVGEHVGDEPVTAHRPVTGVASPGRG